MTEFAEIKKKILDTFNDHAYSDNKELLGGYKAELTSATNAIGRLTNPKYSDKVQEVLEVSLGHIISLIPDLDAFLIDFNQCLPDSSELDSAALSIFKNMVISTVYETKRKRPQVQKIRAKFDIYSDIVRRNRTEREERERKEKEAEEKLWADHSDQIRAASVDSQPLPSEFLQTNPQYQIKIDDFLTKYNSPEYQEKAKMPSILDNIFSVIIKSPIDIIINIKNELVAFIMFACLKHWGSGSSPLGALSDILIDIIELADYHQSFSEDVRKGIATLLKNPILVKISHQLDGNLLESVRLNLQKTSENYDEASERISKFIINTYPSRYNIDPGIIQPIVEKIIVSINLLYTADYDYNTDPNVIKELVDRTKVKVEELMEQKRETQKKSIFEKNHLAPESSPTLDKISSLLLSMQEAQTDINHDNIALLILDLFDINSDPELVTLKGIHNVLADSIAIRHDADEKAKNTASNAVGHTSEAIYLKLILVRLFDIYDNSQKKEFTPEFNKAWIQLARDFIHTPEDSEKMKESLLNLCRIAATVPAWGIWRERISTKTYLIKKIVEQLAGWNEDQCELFGLPLNVSRADSFKRREIFMAEICKKLNSKENQYNPRP